MTVEYSVLDGDDDSLTPAPKVSVIIPLYYAEEYVDDLLVQLRTQPLEDIEIICVIDGSADNTLDIVKSHAESDSRIQWIYQENAGAGAARNAGLKLVHGEYLSFLDVDDLYDIEFLTKMYGIAKAHDADLAVCQFKHVDCQTGKVEHGDGFRLDRVPIDAVFEPLSLTDPFSDIFTGPTNKLYRREMIEQEALRFSTTKVANDNSFVLSSIAASKRIVAISDSLIEVRRYVNPQSISSNRSLHTEDMFESFQNLYTWLIEHNLFKCYSDSYMTAWASALHYNATYEHNENFIKAAAKTLACDEPWCSMNDKELRHAARLETGLIGLKRLVAAREADPAVRALELQRLDNEEAAIQDIIRLLNSDYSKNIPQHSSMLGGIITHLKRKGIRHSVENLAHRLGRRS